MPSNVLIKGRDAAFFAERLAPALPALRFHAAHDPAEALAKGAEAEILIIRTDEIFAELIDRMPKLRLIQALTTGTDHIQALPNLPKHVTLAAATPTMPAPITPTVFLACMTLTDGPLPMDSASSCPALCRASTSY